MTAKEQSDNYIEQVLREKLETIRQNIKWEHDTRSTHVRSLVRIDANIAEMEDKERQLISWLDYSKAR
jgi:hypothetical protein